MKPSQSSIEVKSPGADVPDPDNSPVRHVNGDEMRRLGIKLESLFSQYKSDRKIAELRWLRNQRQYLGLYDPEIEKVLSANRSRAYPRITRVKCISTLARLMNLMFPGNERNWKLEASPSPDMPIADVKAAIAEAQQRDSKMNVQPELTSEYITNAVKTFAEKKAKNLSTAIDDQLQELGGDQTYDYIQLNRQALASGILYGLGVLRGPFARATTSTTWELDKRTNEPVVKTKKVYKPLFEFLPVWDFYPDLSAKTFNNMDGHFIRLVMSRSQIKKLCDRSDFFGDTIDQYLKAEGKVGNYRPQDHETQLREMGLKVNVNEQKAETSKYEIIIWNGPISGEFLQSAGVDVAADKLTDEIDAEVWTIGGHVIKCDMNVWRSLDVDVKTIHPFIFDPDDTSPIGQGLPNVIRDSQMSISAATRMLLDNASVVCGPNLELNTDLLRADQDLDSITAYKFWYREGRDLEAQWPAVREIKIDSHLNELLQVVKLFMEFADAETFVGPATGGDMSKAPSEPMRTAAGASMLRGDAALPFKDIVRAFDSFTQSVITSLVMFNKKFNPSDDREGDFNVIARGATSMIAKEMRGMQVDQLATTLTPEEKLHIDERKLLEARLAVRDCDDLMVTQDEADRRKAAQDAAAADQQDQAKKLAEANVRKLLSDAFKNIALAGKNSAQAEDMSVETSLKLLEQGLKDAIGSDGQQPGALDQGAVAQQDNGGGGPDAAPPAPAPGADEGPPGGGAVGGGMPALAGPG